MIIFVSAGHSNTDPGACANGHREADIVLDLRNYTAFYLKRDLATYKNMTILTDGEGDDNMPLAQAATIARKSDLAIEFHMNAARDQQAEGVECLSQPKDKALSQEIAREIIKVTKSTLRGIIGWKPENAGQHQRLAFVRAGGIIIEVDFITNALMCETVVAKRWLIAKAVANAVINFLKKEGKL